MSADDFAGGSGADRLSHYNRNRPFSVQLEGTQRAPFGGVHTQTPTPIVQEFMEDFHDPRSWKLYSGQDAATFSTVSGLGQIAIDNSILGYATMQTRSTIPYKPGYGIFGTWTTRFNSGVANSLQFAGSFNAEDGFGFGYNGTNFGIFHRYGRKLHVQKFTFTTPSSVKGNVTVTLNGTPHTVTLDAEGTTAADARNITTGLSQYFENGPLGSVYSYATFQEGNSVYFLRQIHGPATGAFSIGVGSTNAVVTGTVFQLGEDGTQDWYYQTGWNIDPLNGSGLTPMNLNPQNLNIYAFSFGWLGSLPITFYVGSDTHQDLHPVHTIPWTNRKKLPSVTDPRFPFTMAVASAGSTTPMSMAGGSVSYKILGGFDGYAVHNQTFTATINQTGTTVEKPIVSLQASRFDTLSRRTSRRRFNCTLRASNESNNKICTFTVYKGTKRTLEGYNFERIEPFSSILLDTSGTAVITNNGDLVKLRSFTVAPLSNERVDLSTFPFGPEEVLTVTTKTSSTTAAVSLSINGEEDV